MDVIPAIQPVSIVSGLAGVFSGFIKHVNRVAAEYNLDPRDIFYELGKRKVVAGQEDMIIEVAPLGVYLVFVEKTREIRRRACCR